MRIIAIASPKGGSTKTTTTSTLAVRACQESVRVAMIDLNSDQGNLTQWWISRGEPMNPRLISDVENLIDDVEVLRGAGFEWLFIDTPPIDLELIEAAVMVADAVVVPIRLSILDLGTIDPVVEMCRDHDKPFAFLLGAIDNKFKALAATAVAELVKEGPVFATRVSYRLPYVNAMTAGRTGPEIAKELRPEVGALWEEVKRLAEAKPAVKVRAAND